MYVPRCVQGSTLIRQWSSAVNKASYSSDWMKIFMGQRHYDVHVKTCKSCTLHDRLFRRKLGLDKPRVT